MARVSVPGAPSRDERRARLRLAAAALAALLVVAALIAVATSRVSDPKAQEDAVTGYAGALLPAGVPAPDFTLRDEDGRAVSLRDFRGKPVLVTFVYSTCEESCGPQLQLIRGALDDLGRDLPVLAISADATQDTPERARRFLVEQRMIGRARFLLGSPRQLDRVYRGFFVQPQTSEAEHQTRLVLLDGRGQQRVGYFLENVTPEGIAADVLRLERAAVADAGQDRRLDTAPPTG